MKLITENREARHNYFLESLLTPFNCILIGISIILVYTDIYLAEVPSYANIIVIAILVTASTLLDFFEMPHINSDYKKPEDLHAEDRYILPNILMRIIETPGHSAGGVSFYFPDYGVLLTGDTLFRDSFGRYDLPGGNSHQLQQSISKLYDMNFPDDTYVVHGHGVDSTIEILKKQNPYLLTTSHSQKNSDNYRYHLRKQTYSHLYFLQTDKVYRLQNSV